MKESTEEWWRVLLDARWLVFAVVATVAVFSFIVSYSHIYDLGLEHAQYGTAARLLPLSVDLLIVGSSLVLFIQDRQSLERKSVAFWLPRLVLYAAIGATVAANVAYGLPFGWLSAVISGWPGAAFVAAVEVGILVARPAGNVAGELTQEGSPGSPATRPGTVPSSPVEAAKVSMAATARAGNPWSRNQVQKRWRLTRAEATEVWAPYQIPPESTGEPDAPAGAAAGPSPAGVPSAPAGVTPDSPAGALPPAPAGVLNGKITHD